MNLTFKTKIFAKKNLKDLKMSHFKTINIQQIQKYYLIEKYQFIQLLKMQLDEQRQAQRFVQQFKQIDFQVPFDNLKRQVVVVDGKKYYKDLYLVERLLPTLTQGMQALSKQLQELMNNTDQIDPEVRSRFNPCLFLGQYLMRRNQNINQKTHLTTLLLNYSKVQTFNRLFVTRFETMHKIFSKSISKDKKSCDISELKLYARDIDQLLDCKGQLKNYLSNNRYLSKNKDQIKLNDILDELAKYLVSKTNLTQKDVEKVLNEVSPPEK